jgi:hypothetical protein
VIEVAVGEAAALADLDPAGYAATVQALRGAVLTRMANTTA